MGKKENLLISIDNIEVTKELESDYNLIITNRDNLIKSLEDHKNPSLIILSKESIKTLSNSHKKDLIEQNSVLAVVDNDKDVAIAIVLGAVEVIKSPINIVELQHRIRSLLQLRQIRKEFKRTNKKLESITKIGDRQQETLRTLNKELDSYKNSLEDRVEETTKEIKLLYKEIEDTQKELIFTMGAIGESRSQETGNHVKRVAEYTDLLAEGYGLNRSEIDILKQASPMHDIGKIGIPDSILNKPSRLTEEEFIVMKEHSQLGFDMLKHSNRILLKSAAIVAHQHHEKWDGTGYPQKLEGEDIHIYGRITALADVFDALGSDRVYKKAWSDEKIIQHFVEQKGLHFDPKLVDIFLKNLKNVFEIRDRFSSN